MYQVHLQVVNPIQCALFFGVHPEKIDQHDICVNGGGRSACRGDSGGPLVDTRTGRQIGIVSYGKPDCSVGFPSIYCKVQDNLEFINFVKNETGNKVQSDETDKDDC